MKKKRLKPDGKMTDADALEAHPDFHDEYLDLVDKHLKKTAPELHALMKRIKSGSVKETT